MRAAMRTVAVLSGTASSDAARACGDRRRAAHAAPAGAGRAVLCLHSSLGSGRQWRPLADTLVPHARVVAPDLHGHGASPPWRGARALRLDDELALLAPAVAGLGGGFDLVGHSYGGAVAMRVALRTPSRVRRLAIYEPALFSLLAQDAHEHAAAAEMRRLRRDLERAMSLGLAERAAERFIDYWSGDGAWRRVSRERQCRYAAGMPAVMQNFATADADRTRPGDYRALRVPVLLLHGEKSPAAARRVVERLAALLPDVEVRRVPGAGHMGPVTHADTVNGLIRDFLGVPADLPAVA